MKVQVGLEIKERALGSGARCSYIRISIHLCGAVWALGTVNSYDIVPRKMSVDQKTTASEQLGSECSEE